MFDLVQVSSTRRAKLRALISPAIQFLRRSSRHSSNSQTSASIPHIYNLPIELLQQILAEASSAHALSRVSRRISIAYAPFRFRNIAASGEQKLTALLSALDAADPSDVRIERLFLCDRVRAEADDMFDVWHSGLGNDPRTLSNYILAGQWHELAGSRVARILAGILRHAAPHAHSICVLSFNQEYTNIFSCLSGLSFPVLRHLVFRPQHGVSLSSLSGGWEMPALQTLVLPELNGELKLTSTRSVVRLFKACAAQLAAITVVDVDDLTTAYGAIAFVKSDLPQTLGESSPDDALSRSAGVRLRLEMHRVDVAQPGSLDADGTQEGVDDGWGGWQWMVESDAAEGYLSYDQWKAEWEVM